MNLDDKSGKTLVEACARAAHEVNRAYCLALGDADKSAQPKTRLLSHVKEG